MLKIPRLNPSDSMKKKVVHINNDQDYLAERYRINENYLVSASKIALLKIQSWKFASRTPEIGVEYLASIDEIIQKSFFNYVTPAQVLHEESFHYTPKEN